MGFGVLGIDTEGEKQERCLNTLGTAEFLDFAKGHVVAKAVTGCLDTHAVTLLAVSQKPFQPAAKINLPLNHSPLKT